MSEKVIAVGNSNFNWDAFEDGWNGHSRKINEKIRISKKNRASDQIYSHEPYAQHLYDKMSKINVHNVKDAQKGSTVPITDIEVVDDNTLIATVGHGATEILVDLNKENKLFEQFNVSDTQEHLTKEEFVKYVKHNPEFKERFLSMNLSAKLGNDTRKGSMWDGYVEKLNNELREQLKLENKAFYATVVSTNTGGFVVEVSDIIRAFMPASMASANKISDYDSFIGRRLEVMVNSWTPRYGFVVSRKKYIDKVRPSKLQPYIDELKNNPDTIYSGKVTGATQFGVFVELDEFITGMLHKSLVSDELRDRMRQGNIETGEEIQVYIDRVENNGRVILSDVCVGERDVIEERRKIEDEAEKKEYKEKKEKQSKTDALETAVANAKTAKQNRQQ